MANITAGYRQHLLHLLRSSGGSLWDAPLNKQGRAGMKELEAEGMVRYDFKAESWFLIEE